MVQRKKAKAKFIISEADREASSDKYFVFIRDQLSTEQIYDIKAETILGGSSGFEMNLAIDGVRVCLKVALKATEETPAVGVSFPCLQNLFDTNGAELEANSVDGLVVIKLKYRSSKQKLIPMLLQVDLDFERARPAKVDLYRPVHDSIAAHALAPTELENLNRNAFLQVAISDKYPRSKLAEAYLEVRLEKKYADLVGEQVHKILEDNRLAVTKFFSSGEPIGQNITEAFRQRDIPTTVILTTLVESPPYWAEGRIQSGVVLSYTEGGQTKWDCPVGMWQIRYPTALDINKRLNDQLKIFAPEIKINRNGKKTCVDGKAYKDLGDARTDFQTASLMAAEYYKFIAELYEKNPKMKTPFSSPLTTHSQRSNDTGLITDPRLYVAGYNQGPYGTQRALLQEAFPNFWTLYEMGGVPAETKNYVLKWLALREINKNYKQRLPELASP